MVNRAKNLAAVERFRENNPTMVGTMPIFKAIVIYRSGHELSNVLQQQAEVVFYYDRAGMNHGNIEILEDSNFTHSQYYLGFNIGFQEYSAEGSNITIEGSGPKIGSYQVTILPQR